MSMISLRSRLSFMKGLAPSAATRAGLSGSSRGSPADALGDLRVTVRASPPGTSPRTSYSSRSERPVRFPGDFAGPSHGAPSISFVAPSVDRMFDCSIGGWVHVVRGWRCGGAAPLGCCRHRRTGPGTDGQACPGSREYRAGGQQTAQSRALAAGRLVSRSGAQLTTALYSGAFLPGGAWGADKVVDGPFHGQKPLVRLLHPHYPRRRSGQGVCIPQVERAIAVHLCPRNADTWRNRLRLPSKACKLTAAFAAKAVHLSQLGLRVNWENSKLSPVQRISFLCVELDSVSMTARLTEERAQAVLNCLSSFRGRNVVPLKQFQRLLGHMPYDSAPYGTHVQIYDLTSMCGSWTGRGRLEWSTTGGGRDHHSA